MEDGTNSPFPSTGRRKSSRQVASEENSDAIKVVCRFRPTNAAMPPKSGTTGEPSEYYSFTSDRSVQFISESESVKSFAFDKVFSTDTAQSEVFSEVCGVVESVMSGFNGTIMAYGQTSAGKSWTMEGPSLWDLEYQGVIPRCVDALFDAIEEADPDIEFQVTISYYEIYCEKVRDLLNPSQFNLKIRESRSEGIIVQDVTEVFCTDRDGMLRVIDLGKTNRASAPTLMNAESSRSHSMVTLTVEQNNIATGRKKRGMLFLVDLAGSEKVSKTGASGMRLEEAKNINRSLTTLGMVINALCDGAPHIPYRDSTLTLILKDALGGNSKTTLVICCNPDLRHTPETLSTLRFGERAKRIKNHAHVNEEFSPEELKRLLAASRREIEKLKRKLAVAEANKQCAGSCLDNDSPWTVAYTHARGFPAFAAAAAGGSCGRDRAAVNSVGGVQCGRWSAVGIGGRRGVRLDSTESMGSELDMRSPLTADTSREVSAGEERDQLFDTDADVDVVAVDERRELEEGQAASLGDFGEERVKNYGDMAAEEVGAEQQGHEVEEEEEEEEGEHGRPDGGACDSQDADDERDLRQTRHPTQSAKFKRSSGKMRSGSTEDGFSSAGQRVVAGGSDIDSLQYSGKDLHFVEKNNECANSVVTIAAKDLAEMQARLASMQEELEEERNSNRRQYRVPENCFNVMTARSAVGNSERPVSCIPS